MNIFTLLNQINCTYKTNAERALYNNNAVIGNQSVMQLEAAAARPVLYGPGLNYVP